MTGGPHLSAAGERERRGKGMAGWANWACRPKVRVGNTISFLFF